MILKYHIISTPFEALVPELVKLDFPVRGNLYAYKEAYDSLCRISPAWPREGNISVTKAKDETEIVRADNCIGESWKHCLAKEVIIEEGISEAKALAAILWELTFHGFDASSNERTRLNPCLQKAEDRRWRIEKTICNIISFTDNLSHVDLEYLFGTNAICDFEFFSRTADASSRVAYIKDNISKYFYRDLSYYSRAEVLLCSSEGYPLSRPEMNALKELFSQLLPSKSIRFSIGRKDLEDPEDIWVFMIVSR